MVKNTCQGELGVIWNWLARTLNHSLVPQIRVLYNLKIEYYIFEAPQFQQPHVTGVSFLRSTKRTILESQEETQRIQTRGVVNCQGLLPQRWQ